MNLLAPLANLFRSQSERQRDAMLAQLEKQRDGAMKRVREAYDYADTVIADWERERDQHRREPGYRGDRKDGGYWPFITTMEDLRRYRGMSREACEGNGYGAGVLDRAVDFVIGDGMQPSVSLRGPHKGAVATGVADADGDGRPDADPAVENVQAVIDDFRRMNDWGVGEEDREEESFRRSQRDAEVCIRFFPGGGKANGIPFVRFVEPEQIDSPPSAEPHERWGIRYRMKPFPDVESKEAWYVYEMDGTGGEWVDSSEIVWHKLGTDRTVLRGMPQFWLVAQALSQCEKLNSAVTEVSAIQAQIAYVREHAPGIMPGQITDFVGSSGDVTGRKATPYGDKYRRVGYGENGTVVDMSSGMKFTSGPVSSGVPGFVQALQSRLRQVCSRFGYPEFFTGDASNGNYASLLAAGGPAERNFKRRQNRFAAFQAAVYRRACEYAVAAGRLSERDLWAVEIAVKPGKVSVSNNLEDAQIDQILIQNKVKSVQTVMQERGLDPRVESANLEAWDGKFGGGAMGLGGMGGDLFGGGDDDGGGGGGGVGESYTQDQYEILSEAGRAGLVRKTLGTDKRGRKIVRWVRPDQDGGGVSRGDVDSIRESLDRAVKDPSSLTPESVALIEKHASELTVDERRKYARALKGAIAKPSREPKTGGDVAPPKLTPEQTKAFYDYSEDIGYDLNATLREGDTPSGREKAVYDAVSKVIEEQGTIDPPLSVYRALSWSHPEDKAEFMKGVQAGGVVTLNGLQSTSLDREFVDDAFGGRAGGSVLMEIVASKGVRMAGDMTAHDVQREIVLPHGGRYRVIGVDQGTGGKTVVRMEQLA